MTHRYVRTKVGRYLLLMHTEEQTNRISSVTILLDYFSIFGHLLQ